MAGIQLADLQSEKQLAAHIENLNLLGVLCRNGDAVSGRERTRIDDIACRSELQCDWKGGLFVAALGDGSRFITIDPSNVPILDAWLENRTK